MNARYFSLDKLLACRVAASYAVGGLYEPERGADHRALRSSLVGDAI